MTTIKNSAATLSTDAAVVAELFATWLSEPLLMARAMADGSATAEHAEAFSVWAADADNVAATHAALAARAEQQQRAARAQAEYAIARSRTEQLLDNATTALDAISPLLATRGITRQIVAADDVPSKTALHLMADDGAFITITRVPAEHVTDQQRGTIKRDLAAQVAGHAVGTSHSVR